VNGIWISWLTICSCNFETNQFGSLNLCKLMQLDYFTYKNMENACWHDTNTSTNAHDNDIGLGWKMCSIAFFFSLPPCIVSYPLIPTSCVVVGHWVVLNSTTLKIYYHIDLLRDQVTLTYMLWQMNNLLGWAKRLNKWRS
jgi:hypothetical protein